ncbi:uncharacterized protein TNCV_1938341 [Trichonephila clavipes]|nr:uncharacterized protein TNCV_1938341 [Trichonephila clavipes]
MSTEQQEKLAVDVRSFIQAVDSTLVYCYSCTKVGFVNSSTSAAPLIACTGAFIQDPPHGKPPTAASAMASCFCAWQADWHQVVFSNESRFNLWDHDGRIRVRRNAGLLYSEKREFGPLQSLSVPVPALSLLLPLVFFTAGAIPWDSCLKIRPEKLTVWCALWAGGTIGPYFFKNDEGHNVTVNGDRYRAMITNFFIPKLNNHDIQELWFQQDGATCHTARATIDLLKDTFGDRLISRFGPVNWPPRSCNLTPLDYFLWGYVNSMVYADKPQTLDHLEDNIRRVIADIRPQMLEKVIENWTSRLDYIRASRGSSMPEIIFKM